MVFDILKNNYHYFYNLSFRYLLWFVNSNQFIVNE